MEQPRGRIGVIISGSLTEGLSARVDAAHPIESLRVGQFLLVDGRQHEFFAMLTDVELGATSPAVLVDPPLTTRSSKKSLPVPQHTQR